MTEISDELLVAYVDGQLARAQTRAVERVLEQDEIAATRVAALREAHARLEAAFDAILAAEVAELAPDAVPAARPGSVFVTKALRGLGLIAALLAGVAAGYGLHALAPSLSIPGLGAPAAETSLATWQTEAARAQSLMGRESFEIGLESQANTDFVSLQLGYMFGREISLPSLEKQGFRFARAQLLRHEGEPFAQIVYLPKAGAPLALYAKPAGAPASRAFSRVGEIGAVSWSAGGVSYLLAGAYGRPELMRLSHAVAAGLLSEPLPPKDTQRLGGSVKSPAR